MAGQLAPGEDPEEDEAKKTRDEAEPKPDRIDEMIDKLVGLAGEAEREATGEHIANARDYLRRDVREHPGGECAP